MKRILAVDDEEHILELLSYNLLNEGYEVVIHNKIDPKIIQNFEGDVLKTM